MFLSLRWKDLLKKSKRTMPPTFEINVTNITWRRVPQWDSLFLGLHTPYYTYTVLSLFHYPISLCLSFSPSLTYLPYHYSSLSLSVCLSYSYCISDPHFLSPSSLVAVFTVVSPQILELEALSDTVGVTEKQNFREIFKMKLEKFPADLKDVV